MAIGLAMLSIVGCGPSPDELCDHIVELIVAEAPEWEPQQRLLVAACVESEEGRETSAFEALVPSERNRCIMDAASLDQLITCTEAEPDPSCDWCDLTR